MAHPPGEQLIRRVLGSNFLELSLTKIHLEELDSESVVRITVREGETPVEVEGRGVGMVDAIYGGLLDRYAREYQSLKTIQLTGFKVAADIETKKAQAGVDAVGRVTLDVTNSEGRPFSFTDASRSVTSSSARAVLAMVQYFVNAERAFLTLHNARRDALSRGREDLVARYTAEMAEVVQSTSYAEVIANIRKEIS
ncbi:MAG: alpha-isopropylmalate synthase regulatory domain-containing protein [Kofleriaceae bacterium]